jgi:hypothetical protein
MLPRGNMGRQKRDRNHSQLKNKLVQDQREMKKMDNQIKLQQNKDKL